MSKEREREREIELVGCARSMKKERTGPLLPLPAASVMGGSGGVLSACLSITIQILSAHKNKPGGAIADRSLTVTTTVGTVTAK
jgi:hypothetical protein